MHDGKSSSLIPIKIDYHKSKNLRRLSINNDLEVILSEGESYSIEFKENADKSFASEVCAFANASGGRVFIGVHDSGKFIGTDRSSNARSRIQDILNQIEPHLPVVIASLLHRVHYIERMGTDIRRMNHAMEMSGLEKPIFQTDGLFFKVIFKRDLSQHGKSDVVKEPK